MLFRAVGRRAQAAFINEDTGRIVDADSSDHSRVTAHVSTHRPMLFGQMGDQAHFAYVPLESADIAAILAWFGEGRFILPLYKPLRSMMGVSARLRRKALKLLHREAGYLWGLDDWYDDGLQEQLFTLHRAHRFDPVVR